ncbi:hypothetical protein B0H13DRAFT_1877472 [Mycena leptocephala]|nr:hypothetical protein B0H13DRAFT_1877472 [Mycena leptocephala]
MWPVPLWKCAAVKDCGDPATNFFFFLSGFLIPAQFTPALERTKWFDSLSATGMLQDSLSTVRRVTLRNGAALLRKEEETQWRIAIEMQCRSIASMWDHHMDDEAIPRTRA